MPLYHTLLTTKPAFPPSGLTRLVKDISKIVLEGGGVVRSIENHGVRPLPYRFKSKHMDSQGLRYHNSGRFISMHFDASPTKLPAIDKIVKLEEGVLRTTTMRGEDWSEKINVSKAKKNPFMP